MKLPRHLSDNAMRVTVFNSGLNVWLYDRGFRDELLASGAFEISADPAVFEKAMREFVRLGRLMSYDLMQDDSIDVAISIREPLSRKELGKIPWREPQQAFLSLPTGRLVIESNDSLTIRSLSPTDPGGEVSVPPGDYLVTLYRVDWDTLAEDEIEWDGPSEFITLTAGPAAKPVTDQPISLPWDIAIPDAETFSVIEGVYSGSVIFDDDLMAMRVALDREVIAKLGLTDSSVTVITVHDVPFECALVWVQGDRMKGEYYDRLERLRPPAEFPGKEWAICNLKLETSESTYVFCLRRDSKQKITKAMRNVWHPATMRVIEARALE